MIKRNYADEVFSAIEAYGQKKISLADMRTYLERVTKLVPEVMVQSAPAYQNAQPFLAALIHGDADLYKLVKEFGGKVTSPDGRIHVPSEPQGMSPFEAAITHGNFGLAAHIAYYEKLNCGNSLSKALSTLAL
ncbi:MAG: hypothetical protein WC612_05620 [Bdellovibrionales bacterium]|jgi:hypothetical protein